jgi:nitrite reductase/ring-hydroxylating ferredoxin subunit/DMSO/TMAO reductase YedYZ heme-binding membrane subunit
VSNPYPAVRWNRNKRVYDAVLLAGVGLYLALFTLVARVVWHGSTPVLLTRALGSCGFLMLHVVLCIGPLARLDRRFLPLLYNRRHLGVATFLVGLAHAALAVGYYHGFGRVHPIVSLLTSNTRYGSLTGFPFETLGLGALVVLFLMASTSHDFWQRNLGPSVWKGLHMLVYLAYTLLVLHVGLGALQSETNPVHAVLVGTGLAIVVGLHLLTGWRERRRDVGVAVSSAPGPGGSIWVEVGGVDDIPEGRAMTACLPGRERVAVFRYGGRVSAVTNVCAHQRGPLGEGKVVEGCITCPWHGWEYRPEDGRSPPPFHEKVATYRVRVEGRRVLLNPAPLPPGTAVEPARFEE